MSGAYEMPMRCQALKKDGTPCQAFAVRNGCCIGHQGADNVRWRQHGGVASSNANRAVKLLPSRLQPMVNKLETVFDELYRSSGTGRQARDASALASVALAIGKLFQLGESEQRLRDLEASVAEWQRTDRSRWGT
jgi:hypothetical protein